MGSVTTSIIETKMGLRGLKRLLSDVKEAWVGHAVSIAILVEGLSSILLILDSMFFIYNKFSDYPGGRV